MPVDLVGRDTFSVIYVTIDCVVDRYGTGGPHYRGCSLRSPVVDVIQFLICSVVDYCSLIGYR